MENLKRMKGTHKVTQFSDDKKEAKDQMIGDTHELIDKADDYLIVTINRDTTEKSITGTLGCYGNLEDLFTMMIKQAELDPKIHIIFMASLMKCLP